MSFAIVKRLQKIDTSKMLNVILRQLDEQIIKMNTESQLFKRGITIEGAKIVPKYADSTVRMKRRLGLPTNRVTTRQTGGYHQAFKIKYGAKQFELTVNFKVKGFNLPEHLEKRYGGLEGLTDSNIEKLTRLIQPQLIEMIKTQI